MPGVGVFIENQKRMKKNPDCDVRGWSRRADDAAYNLWVGKERELDVTRTTTQMNGVSTKESLTGILWNLNGIRQISP